MYLLKKPMDGQFMDLWEATRGSMWGFMGQVGSAITVFIMGMVSYYLPNIMFVLTD